MFIVLISVHWTLSSIVYEKLTFNNTSPGGLHRIPDVSIGDVIRILPTLDSKHTMYLDLYANNLTNKVFVTDKETNYTALENGTYYLYMHLMTGGYSLIYDIEIYVNGILVLEDSKMACGAINTQFFFDVDDSNLAYKVTLRNVEWEKMLRVYVFKS